MSELIWRQGHGIDPLREWGRRDLPKPRDGFVWIDLDGAIRRYGNNFGLDPDGDLMLYEKKEMSGTLTQEKARVYNWVDHGIETGDYAGRYRGSHVLRVVYPKDSIPKCDKCGAPMLTPDEAYAVFLLSKLFWDDKAVTHEELRAILLGASKSA